MKALVGAFNQEKALVEAISVIVQPVVEPMEHCTALLGTLHDRNLKQNGWRLGGGGWARPCEHSVSNINN